MISSMHVWNKQTFYSMLLHDYSDRIYITEVQTFKYNSMKQEHKSCEGKMNCISYIYSIYIYIKTCDYTNHHEDIRTILYAGL
jgi:hypothetical protein